MYEKTHLNDSNPSDQLPLPEQRHRQPEMLRFSLCSTHLASCDWFSLARYSRFAIMQLG